MNATPRSVLFLAPEPLGPGLTGPALRTVKLAEQVAEDCAVTLAAPGPSTFPDGPFATLETGAAHDQDLGAAMRAHDVAVVQTLPSPRQLLVAMRNAPRLVVDLIAPLALEAAEMPAGDAERRSAVRWRVREMVAHLAAADLVLCSNEKQRDLALGVGIAAGLVEGDTPLQERIAVVPHGIDPEPPRRRGSPLRRDANERIAIWGGGMWSWLDPLTAIRAIEGLRARRPELKLAFVGLEHPDPAARRAHAAGLEEAMAYATERDLEEAVVFRPRWLAYEDYVDHLLDADVGVSLNGPTLEGRFASRTRVLDYLHAGLPVVCTSGDTMSELVTAHGVGEAVEPLDVDGCAAALDRLTNGAPSRIEDRSALEPFFWRTVARPLVEYCVAAPPARRSRAEAFAIVAREFPAFVGSLRRTGGLAGAVRRAGARQLGRRSRRR